MKKIFGIIIIVGLLVLVNQFFRWRMVDRWTKANQERLESRGDMKDNPAVSKHNRLKNEKSPYLLQHADNPVHWFPWGEEAFEQAKKEDKPIFLSIGYSTCHWCHVMEHESFENQEIADILNEYFVSIKVDREERPDVDHIYMSAVVNLTGSGGWPLSVFLTHDKKPFFGGTYFPPESRWGSPGFKEILISTSDQWQNNRKKVLRVGDALSEQIQQPFQAQGAQASLTKDTLQDAYLGFARDFDNVYGGFGHQPKFPTSHNLSFLLRYWKRTGDAQSLAIVEKTLKEMANGGMYDQLGGGFHRYSTDRKWHVPHFEKMLYDQAILTKTYLEAFQATKQDRYAETAKDIFEYVLRDMRGKLGGFYSAEDADSLPPEEFANITPDPTKSHEKKEGAFYVWTYDEIVDALGQDTADIFNYHFGIEKNGNADFDPHGEFVGKNILFIKHNIYETAQHFKRSEQEVKKIIQEASAKLFTLRSKRPRPHLDDKVMVDWNGLMISSFALGSRVLDDSRYLSAAEQAAQFILKNLVRKDGRLLHRYRDGDAAILGTLEDYAFFVHGLIDLYEATFKPKYLKEAKRLTVDMLTLFWDDENGGFFFTADDAEKLLMRPKEIYDGAIPSGNSIAALNLIRLAHLTLELDWEDKASQLMSAFAHQVAARPNSYGQLMIALDYAIGPSKEIVIAGPSDDAKTKEMIDILYHHFLPNKVVTHRPASDQDAEDIIALVPFVKNQKSFNGEATAYVCQNYQCQKPTSDLEEYKSFLGITR